MDPIILGSIGAAGISSAADILGGFLSRPDLSQRDLMWEQQKLVRWGLERNPRYQVEGLRRAGLNPLLAMTKGQVQGPANISVPTPYEDPLGKAIGKAGASAVQAFRVYNEVERMRAETENIKETNRKIRAEIANIAANTNLVSAKAATEFENPALQRSVTELNSARSDVERQNLKKSVVETAIKQEELTMAEKDALIASLDVEFYESTIGEIVRWLKQLGFSPSGAVGAAHALWKLFHGGRRK